MPTEPLPFDPTPQSDEDYELTRSLLKERFAAWSATNAPDLGGDAGESLIHHKRTYLDGDLNRWGRADLESIYLEIFPAKVVMDDGDLDATLNEGKAFITFLSESGWLADDSDDLAAMIDLLDHLGPAFREAMADESLYSPGKQFWSQALAEGVKMDDEDSLDAFMQTYNARINPRRPPAFGPRPLGLPPRDLRRPSSPPSLRMISGRATPPGTPPQPKRSGDKRKRRGR